MLKLLNLNKKFGTKSILSNLSITFPKGLILIKGPSGSGKTTLLNIIGGLEPMDSGSVQNLDSKRIGYIFQFFYLIPNLTVLDNVLLPKNIWNNKEKYRDKAVGILTQLGIESLIDKYPKDCSGGEQQRVAIARCLIQDSDIILADEPTGNLDPKNEEMIIAIFKYLKTLQKTVIIVSHNPKFEDFVDTIYSLQEGDLVKFN